MKEQRNVVYARGWRGNIGHHDLWLCPCVDCERERLMDEHISQQCEAQAQAEYEQQMNDQPITREEYDEVVAGIAPETLTWGYDGKVFFFHSRNYKHRFVTPEMMSRAVSCLQEQHRVDRAEAIRTTSTLCRRLVCLFIASGMRPFGRMSPTTLQVMP